MPSQPDQIERLLNEGDALAASNQHADALTLYGNAWAALPEPKDAHELAVSILGAIADSCFFLQRWPECRDAIQQAFRCGADESNPFFRIRLGESLLELGDLSESANWLAPVYLMEGRRPFACEDPKYLESFRPRLKPPAGGWPEGW